MNDQQNNSHFCILAIESSCDDTSVSVFRNGKIYSNVISAQEIHAQYGGVVPEWASRKHQQNIVSTVDSALKKADTDIAEITAVACTQGPGLLGSLLVGYTFAKGLAISLDIPLINVDHLEAHVYSHFIDEPKPSLPFLCLLASGGHTQIVKIDENKQATVLGKTIDDAAGEAFDKIGKLLGLDYPSGPIIDANARKGNPKTFIFSTSKVEGIDFSFSGLKTSVLYFLKKEIKANPNFVQENIFDLCASIQHTIVSYLMSKMNKAIEQTGIQHVGIAGGVAANSELREALQELAKEHDGVGYIPAMEYCTDNAAMIAYVASLHLKKKQFGTLNDVCYTRI